MKVGRIILLGQGGGDQNVVLSPKFGIKFGIGLKIKSFNLCIVLGLRVPEKSPCKKGGGLNFFCVITVKV